MFKARYETRYGDYKDFDTIKFGSLLDIIQDVSTKNSTDCGYGIFKMRDMNRAWLLKGMNIKIEGDVKTLTPIDVCTAVKPLKGAISERCCILMQEGEVKLKSIADWFLFDTIKKKPVRIPEDMASSYQVYDFDDDFFTYRKPQIIEDAPCLYSVRVSNRDIDTNCHLNNEKGAELLMDALPFDFRFNLVKTLFKRPCFLGDELEVCMKKIESGYYVHLQTKEKEVCVIGTFETEQIKITG